MQTKDFTLVDSQKNPHEYTVTPHPTSEGSMIVARLIGMAGGPIARLASSNLDVLIELIPELIAEFQERERSDDPITDAEFLAVVQSKLGDLSDLDLDLQQILSDVLAAIFEAGGDEFIQSLLKRTYRDGKSLGESHVYDTAYQANYAELFKAVWEVIKVNGFLPSLGIS